MQHSQHLPYLVVVAVLVQRLAELRQDFCNVDILRKHGAKEAWTRLPWIALSVEWIVFGLAVVEFSVFSPKPIKSLWLLGFTMIVLGSFVKLWARFYLGQLWTLRLLYIPGVEVVRTGPYRWLRHPEYLGRFLESCGICLFLHSMSSLILYLGCTALILPGLLKFENEQLSILGTHLPSRGRSA